LEALVEAEVILFTLLIDWNSPTQTIRDFQEKQKEMQLPQIPVGDVVDQQAKANKEPLEFPAIPSGSPKVSAKKKEEEPRKEAQEPLLA
jgi:hypothetical protein